MLSYRLDNHTVSSDIAEFHAMLLFRVCVCTPLSVWSVLTGVVNVITYYRMGLRDGVNQNFFILSAADALQGVNTMADTIWNILGLVTKLDSSLVIHSLLTAAYSFPMGVSIITTTVIAVVRCCCVSMPFSVQRTLTASKQLAAILFLSGDFTAVIIYTSMDIQLFPSSPDDSVFKSKPVSQIWDSARLTLVFASFAIIVISMIILICALKKSSRLHRGFDADSSFTLSYIRSVRDRRIIKGIFLILALFVICYSTKIIIAILKIVSVKSGQLRQGTKSRCTVSGQNHVKFSDVKLEIRPQYVLAADIGVPHFRLLTASQLFFGKQRAVEMINKICLVSNCKD
ncbi:hypothetical protein EGW08_007119 [Elysia chlorotica]|uniref:G-protein coupled receptors family 1 profile domain-containing protein n=1 Tax=Elysia chlorotica TaxID=188477 RepID=A0A433TU78_ELYCH|nr:hypothetical protein EGW08_007119 [Elysia chlorotica]